MPAGAMASDLFCVRMRAQTAMADTFALPASLAASAAPNLRTLLLSGDFFLGGVVAGARTVLLPCMTVVTIVLCTRETFWPLCHHSRTSTFCLCM